MTISGAWPAAEGESTVDQALSLHFKWSMKTWLFPLLFALIGCQSFQAGRAGVAGITCPSGYLSTGNGLCRPVESLSSQELSFAQQNYQTQANSADPRERVDAENALQKIAEANQRLAASAALTGAPGPAQYGSNGQVGYSGTQSPAQYLGIQTTPLSYRQEVEDGAFKAFMGVR